MAPLPLIKIAAVLFKEISKPLAAGIKRRAVEHPRLRMFATRVGRTWELASQRVEHTFAGNRLATLKPISDTHALTVGAELMSQSFLLSSAIGLVLLEYYRTSSAKIIEDREKLCRKMERQAGKEERLQRIESELKVAQERILSLESKMKDMGSGFEGLISYKKLEEEAR